MNAGLTPRARQALAGFGLAAVAALYLAVALPTSIWLGNRGEFSAGWSALLAPLLAPAAVPMLLYALLAGALPPAGFARAQALLATFALLAWVQGTLLVWHYGLFDGSRIDWSVDRWRGWVDAALWIGAVVAVVAWRERAGRIVVRAAVVVCLAQVAVTAVALMTAGTGPRAAAADTDLQAVLADFSPRRNVLHVIADGFQSDIFADLVAEPGGADRARALDGFVFYRDNLGAFPQTHLAVPAMLSGQAYRNDEPLPRYLDRAMGPASIFAAARAAGYETQVGSSAGGITPIYQRGTFARVLPIPERLDAGAWPTARAESLLLADLALFRVVPHFAKRIVHNDQRWFLQALSGQQVAGSAFLAHNAFLHALARNMTARQPRPTYKTLHLMLSHQPWVARFDCAYAGGPLPYTRDRVRNQARCSLDSLLGVLATMRRLGIYDSATIVISGDHGSFVPPVSLGGDVHRNGGPVLAGQMRPLLLVKPPGARGPLRISDAPTSVLDTSATIADAAGIPGRFPGTSVLRLRDGAIRPRRFFLYTYDKTEWGAQFVSEIREYRVDGRSDDMDRWSLERVMPPGGAAATPAH